MAATARIDLGLSSREFWEMTPRQFALLVERFEARVRREAAMHGIKIDAPAKPTGMGPEVFAAFERTFTEG